MLSRLPRAEMITGLAVQGLGPTKGKQDGTEDVSSDHSFAKWQTSFMLISLVISKAIAANVLENNQTGLARWAIFLWSTKAL